MTTLTVDAVARMVDLSAVRAETDEEEVRLAAALARRRNCACLFTLPAMTPLARDLLADAPGVHVGGTVGFPSGGNITAIKVAEAQELLRLGCDELDMVIGVGLLRSGQERRVFEDVRAVVEAAGSAPVKAILECHHLTEAQIRRACELCVEAGAAWIKTGTGWAPTGATRENIALIKAAVGDRAGVKAAGGIRNLETLAALYGLGARRFGISYASALHILEQAESAPADATY